MFIVRNSSPSCHDGGRDLPHVAPPPVIAGGRRDSASQIHSSDTHQGTAGRNAAFLQAYRENGLRDAPRNGTRVSHSILIVSVDTA